MDTKSEKILQSITNVITKGPRDPNFTSNAAYIFREWNYVCESGNEDLQNRFFEFQLMCKRGTGVWSEVTLFYDLDDDDDETVFVGVGTDCSTKLYFPKY